MQKYLDVFYNNKIEIYAYRKTSNNKPCHASILVENRYNYVSNFLNNDEKLKPLCIKRNKKNQYKFAQKLKFNVFNIKIKQKRILQAYCVIFYYNTYLTYEMAKFYS